ncbi:uncharacterized protein SCHCODRAFT_02493744 [Schizophyllum commune H4-8]|nr:uncharacterized protein SCHCODRAFT_02493744 [Schizophyllum commune H4-8]KAI5896433.1 hypothetical protein SCHCODRAFT_02493744 [Schizophyllum commune H4-8]
MADNTTPCIPINEPPMMMDRTLLMGVTLAGGAWGVLLAVSFRTVQALFVCISSRPQTSRAYAVSLLAFVLLVFACGTLNYAANTELGLRVYVDNRMYPGGPSAFLLAHYADPCFIMGNASYVVASALADALLLYRCYIVWAEQWRVVIFPVCIYLASISMSVFLMYQVSQPATSLWHHINFGLAYFSLSLAVNVILTFLIASRLLAFSKRMKATLGAQHAHTYTSVAALVVESAAPYALTNLVFIVTYGIGSPLSYALLPILSQVMCTSAVLIILRVASGRAWSAQTTERAFNERGNVTSNMSGKGKSRAMALSSIHFKGFESGGGRGSSLESQLAEA